MQKTLQNAPGPIQGLGAFFSWCKDRIIFLILPRKSREKCVDEASIAFLLDIGLDMLDRKRRMN